MKTLLISLILFCISFLTCFGINRKSEPNLKIFSNTLVFNEAKTDKPFKLNIYELLSQLNYSIHSESEFKISESQTIVLAFYVGDLINYNPNESFGTNQLYNGYILGFQVKKTVINLTIESALNQFQSAQIGLILNF